MKKFSYIILAIIFAVITYFYFTTSSEIKTFDNIEYHYFDRFKTVKMGEYYQSDATGKVKDPIEWFVIDEKDDLALLISKDTIVSITYHDHSADITWENSILRMFLNMVFVNENFTDDERKAIVPTYIKNDFKNTYDYMFVLSVDELKEYFKNDSERMAMGTPYGKSFGLSLVSTMPTAENPIENATYYWTRTKGYKQSDVACVNFDGHINEFGYNCYTDGLGVRPCMWVKKEAIWGK